MKILLTGFEGYGAHGVNPTEQLARRLDGTAGDGVTFAGAVLPVSYEGLGERIAELVATHRPDALVLLGLWPGEACIRIERFALNLNAFEIPDNAGNIVRGPISGDAALARGASIPVDDIVADLLAHGIPARASSSAGNFLCNALFFRALDAVERAGLTTRTGFVHVPYLPEQVAQIILAEDRLELHQRADLASMAIETQLAALRRIAATIGKAAS